MNYTLADLEQAVWDRIVDPDSANRAATQPLVDRLLNRAYITVRGLKDDRIYTLSGTTAGTASIIGATKSVTLTPTDIKSIESVFPTSSAGSTTPARPPLALWSMHEIMMMQMEDTATASYAESGVTPEAPSAYAWYREGTTTAASVGKITIACWRQCDAAYHLAMRVKKFITALSSGTDVADVNEQQAVAIIDMASAMAARIIGRPDNEIISIEKSIKEEYQSAYVEMKEAF